MRLKRLWSGVRSRNSAPPSRSILIREAGELRRARTEVGIGLAKEPWGSPLSPDFSGVFRLNWFRSCVSSVTAVGVFGPVWIWVLNGDFKAFVGRAGVWKSASSKSVRRGLGGLNARFPLFFGFKSHDVETGLELVGVVRSIVWTVSLINDDFGAMTDSYRLKGLVSNSKSWIRQMLAGAKCCICASACAWPWMHVWNCAPASHVNSEMFNPCFSCICFDPRFLSMPGSQVPPNWTAVELFSEDLLQDLGCRKRGSLCLHSLLNHYLWGCLKMRWLAKIMVNNTDTFIW